MEDLKAKADRAVKWLWTAVVVDSLALLSQALELGQLRRHATATFLSVSEPQARQVVISNDGRDRLLVWSQSILLIVVVVLVAIWFKAAYENRVRKGTTGLRLVRGWGVSGLLQHGWWAAWLLKVILIVLVAASFRTPTIEASLEDLQGEALGHALIAVAGIGSYLLTIQLIQSITERQLDRARRAEARDGPPAPGAAPER